MFLDQINKKLAALQTEKGNPIPLKPAAKTRDVKYAAKVKSKTMGVKTTRPVGMHTLTKVVSKEAQQEEIVPEEETSVAVDLYALPDYSDDALPVLNEDEDFGDLADLCREIETAEAAAAEAAEAAEAADEKRTPTILPPAFEPEEEPKPVELVPEVTKPLPEPEPEPEPEPKPVSIKPAKVVTMAKPLKPLKKTVPSTLKPLQKGDFKTVGVGLPLDIHAEMTAFLQAHKRNPAIPSSLKLLSLECIRLGFEQLKKKH